MGEVIGIKCSIHVSGRTTNLEILFRSKINSGHVYEGCCEGDNKSSQKVQVVSDGGVQSRGDYPQGRKQQLLDFGGGVFGETGGLLCGVDQQEAPLV